MVRMSREDIVQVGASYRLLQPQKVASVHYCSVYSAPTWVFSFYFALCLILCMYILHVHTNYCAYSCVVSTQPLTAPPAEQIAKSCPLERLDLLSVAAVLTMTRHTFSPHLFCLFICFAECKRMI